VANAPHIPVHLGAMQEAVQWQMKHYGDNLRDGDIILTNHPAAGGSHLPDLTVITPVGLSFLSISHITVIFIIRCSLKASQSQYSLLQIEATMLTLVAQLLVNTSTVYHYAINSRL
jgi:hypothetical protein